MKCRELIQRCWSAVVVYAYVIENADRSAARPDGSHFVLQVGNGFLHARLGIRFDFFDGIQLSGGRRRRFSFHKAAGLIKKAPSPKRHSANYSADRFTHRHSHYIAISVQIENYYRQLVIPAHGDGSGIHDPERQREHLSVANLLELNGIRKVRGDW